MDNCAALSSLLFVAMVVLLFVAIQIHQKQNARRNAAIAEQARKQSEEKLRVYQEAWAAARTSDNLDSFVRCGDYLVKAAREWQPHLLDSVASDVYKEVLKRLKTNPDLKPFALEMGRAAYSARRPQRELTIYDEQAIQNDIFAHMA